jgi:hypothetical protein
MMPAPVTADDGPQPSTRTRRPAAPGRRSTLRTDAPAPAHEPLLSEYLRTFAEREGSASAHIARNPAATVRAARALLALPVLTAETSCAVEGAAVRHEFTRFRGRRWLLGLATVLEIPTDPATYRAGSSRQTLRRKTRAAQANGVTWHRVDDDEERRHLLALANIHERLTEREQYRQSDPDNDDLLDYGLWLVACAADGSPLLLSVTPIDGEWATLRYFRTLSCDEHASVARYWMTDVLVEHLSEAGVRYLIDAAVPHWLPNGLRHFQRMLGFRLVRLRFTGGRPRAVSPPRAPRRA